MSEKENDSLSVESGSCDCSNYNSDISWFYFSKNLQTTHFEFNILNIKKEEKDKEITEDKKDNIKIKVNLIKEQDKIKIPKYIRNEYNSTENFHTNISKKFTNYRSKYKMALKNNRGLELHLNNEKNQDEINRKNTEYKNEPIKEKEKEEEPKYKFQTNNRHLTNKVNRNRFFNIGNPNKEKNNEKNNSLEKVNNNNDDNKEEKKEVENNEENDNKVKVPKYLNFRRRFFNSYKNARNFKEIYKKENDNIKDEKNNNNNKEQTNNDLSKKVRGKTLNERVVTETKNLVLQPGQTVKPKIVTKRMLKPITNIVTNDDGTQNIITENTTLTTTIINELLDSTKKDDDKYPLDIQLVRQHITKTYVTEIESNPYVPKRRFTHFN